MGKWKHEFDIDKNVSGISIRKQFQNIGQGNTFSNFRMTMFDGNQ